LLLSDGTIRTLVSADSNHKCASARATAWAARDEVYAVVHLAAKAQVVAAAAPLDSTRGLRQYWIIKTKLDHTTAGIFEGTGKALRTAVAKWIAHGRCKINGLVAS
jgi:hypothetical protein